MLVQARTRGTQPSWLRGDRWENRMGLGAQVQPLCFGSEHSALLGPLLVALSLRS